MKKKTITRLNSTKKHNKRVNGNRKNKTYKRHN